MDRAINWLLAACGVATGVTVWLLVWGVATAGGGPADRAWGLVFAALTLAIGLVLSFADEGEPGK